MIITTCYTKIVVHMETQARETYSFTRKEESLHIKSATNSILNSKKGISVKTKTRNKFVENELPLEKNEQS